MTWKWSDATHTVANIDLGTDLAGNHLLRSASTAAPDLAAFLADGGQPLPEDPPVAVVKSDVQQLAAALMAKGVLTKADLPLGLQAPAIANGI
jgi:hypothetical protein